MVAIAVGAFFKGIFSKIIKFVISIVIIFVIFKIIIPIIRAVIRRRKTRKLEERLSTLEQDQRVQSVTNNSEQIQQMNDSNVTASNVKQKERDQLRHLDKF